MIAHFILFALCLLTSVARAAAPTPIGETALVIGVGYVHRAQAQLPVARGMSIQVGDMLETSANGHVHLRFVDGAFVSVRPNSRLLIESYQFDPQRHDNGAIKFRLEQGVIRSITGRWGEAARERFRLNTPLAAIGVRGTDFVVQANTEQLRTTVNTGAIVVTPLGEGCRADTVSPCATGKSQLLAAEMGQLMLELTRREGKVRLVPLEELSSNERVIPTMDTTRQKSVRQPESVSDTLAARSVNTPSRIPADVSPLQLAWGHWWSPPGSSSGIATDYATASQGRQVTVGDGSYGLFRQEHGAVVFPGGLTGQASFNLNAAQAQLQTMQGSKEQVVVTAGQLSINFNDSSFLTKLLLMNDQTGIISFSANGQIRDDGIFSVVANGKNVAGAVSVDGREVGYLFSQNLPQGVLSGMTLWKR